MRCFAWRPAPTLSGYEPCPHQAVRQLSDQHYCGFHAEQLRAAALDSFQVYFAERDELIKIGVSRDPAGRVRNLKARLLATEYGGRRREADLHERFMEHRVRGEWFRPCPELLAHIAEQTPAEVAA